MESRWAFFDRRGGSRDILGEAFEKYFQTGEVIRRDKECLNDYEQWLSTFTPVTFSEPWRRWHLVRKCHQKSTAGFC